MTALQHYCAMAQYNRWMNRKLFALAAELTPEERTRDMGAFFASVYGTLNHVYLVDVTWMRRMTGDRERFAFRDARGQTVRLTSATQILHADLEVFRAARVGLDDAIVGWITDLDEATLDRPFRWHTRAGHEHTHPLWWTVSHFFNHQTHHRGQATTLLFQLGHDPGVTDLGIFLTDPSHP